MSPTPPTLDHCAIKIITMTLLQSVGMAQLMKCYYNENCIRHFLSCIILLGYNLFLTFHTGQPDNCDFNLVKEILDAKLAKHPDGGFFLFFKGRHLFVQV